MWAMGDYPAVATEVIAALGPALVEATGIAPGDRVLDIAAGSGNAVDPRRPGRRRRRRQRPHPRPARDRPPGRGAPAGVELRWEVADAEHLPYADAEFDAAISCVGVMFAPHHQEAADELVRVVRPGGRIGLLSWTPAGFIGQMFADHEAVRPAAPARRPAAPAVGRRGPRPRALLGDRVTDVVAETRTLPVPLFADGASFRDFFKRTYGPTIAVYRSLADDPARTAELDEALAAHGDRYVGDGAMEWEYLLLTARRA